MKYKLKEGLIFLYALLIFGLGFLSKLEAQSYYGALDIGYGLGVAQTAIPDGSFNEISPSIFQRTVVKHSYGQGVTANAHIGYKVNRFFSYEVMFSCLKGSTVKKEFVKNASLDLDERYSTLFRVTPNFKVHLTKGKIGIYNRFGGVFGMFGNVFIEQTSQSTSLDIYRKVKYHDGVSFGFMAGTGIEFRLIENLYITTELQVYVQSFAPRKSEIVEYVRDGENLLESLSIAERYTEYVDEYIEEVGGNDENNPSTRLKGFFPFSSVGFNLGVVYYFKKAK